MALEHRCDCILGSVSWRIGSTQTGLGCPVSLGWDHVGQRGPTGVNVMAAQGTRVVFEAGAPYENS